MDDLEKERKGDVVKVEIARQLRSQTPMTRQWIEMDLRRFGLVVAAVGVVVATALLLRPSVPREARKPTQTTGQSDPQGRVSTIESAQSADIETKHPSPTLKLMPVLGSPHPPAAIRVKEPSVVLTGNGPDARIKDVLTGAELWRPTGRHVVAMELSPDGTKAKVDFSIQDAKEAAGVIYSVPAFEELASLPNNCAAERGTGFQWQWLSDKALLGVCKIEKPAALLQGLTALQQESDLAIESVKLFVYDLDGRSMKEVTVTDELASSVFEVGQIRNGHVQLWTRSSEQMWYTIATP